MRGERLAGDTWGGLDEPAPAPRFHSTTDFMETFPYNLPYGSQSNVHLISHSGRFMLPICRIKPRILPSHLKRLGGMTEGKAWMLS
jgi:hypothetical protein